MNQFRRKTYRFSSSVEKGVNVSELITLAENNPLASEIIRLLNVESIKDEYIDIPGAETLVALQKSVNNRYHKEDLDSDLKDITVYSGEDFTINFHDTSDSEYFSDLEIEKIVATPIYSAVHDFFANLYHMDKYASRLIADGNRDIVKRNIEMLKKVHQFA